ncbi:MAG: hypothetical protein LUE93_12335 [Bacteroides sp.]|nr:hypothetical protein [Bacteroides sp.]
MKRIKTKAITWLVVACLLPGCSSSGNDPEYETIHKSSGRRHPCIVHRQV